jgi:hypothetical protein
MALKNKREECDSLPSEAVDFGWTASVCLDWVAWCLRLFVSVVAEALSFAFAFGAAGHCRLCLCHFSPRGGAIPIVLVFETWWLFPLFKLGSNSFIAYNVHTSVVNKGGGGFAPAPHSEIKKDCCNFNTNQINSVKIGENYSPTGLG